MSQPTKPTWPKFAATQQNPEYCNKKKPQWRHTSQKNSVWIPLDRYSNLSFFSHRLQHLWEYLKVYNEKLTLHNCMWLCFGKDGEWGDFATQSHIITASNGTLSKKQTSMYALRTCYIQGRQILTIQGRLGKLSQSYFYNRRNSNMKRKNSKKNLVCTLCGPICYYVILG